MKKLAIIYHSAHGHTEHIATHISEGANSVPNIEVHMLKAEDLAKTPDALLKVRRLHPWLTDLPRGRLWYFQDVHGRHRTPVANPATQGQAGCRVHSVVAAIRRQAVNPDVDVRFCMQHGMLWVGNPILPEQHTGVPYDEAANRLGSWSGMMAQAGHSAPADSFPAGDIKTARMFGKNFSEALHRVSGAGLTFAENLEAFT